MATIRIPQDRWAEVWKFLTSIGPITRISSAPIYEISPQHLEALCHAGLPFELVNNSLSFERQRPCASHLMPFSD
jgi:hypothetical protein